MEVLSENMEQENITEIKYRHTKYPYANLLN